MSCASVPQPRMSPVAWRKVAIVRSQSNDAAENGARRSLVLPVMKGPLGNGVAVVPHTIIRLPRPQLGKFVFSDPKKSFATLSDRPAVLQ